MLYSEKRTFLRDIDFDATLISSVGLAESLDRKKGIETSLQSLLSQLVETRRGSKARVDIVSYF